MDDRVLIGRSRALMNSVAFGRIEPLQRTAFLASSVPSLSSQYSAVDCLRYTQRHNRFLEDRRAIALQNARVHGQNRLPAEKK